MNKEYYSYTDETVYQDVLPNGLTVHIIPKKDYNKTYVSITTPFGSNITNFIVDGKEVMIPPGVAHFLEHKLFEKDGKDVSALFSKNSARVNAFTTNTRTTYLFSATNHIKTNIKTLCDFVLYPSFTDEGIEKEKGIITQEINMYEDDPSSKEYMGLLKQMYPNHPVSTDILGTVESINTINKEILTTAHNAFYQPSQMVLTIVGNVSHEELFTFLKQTYAKIEQKHIVTIIKQEFLLNNEQSSIEHFDVLQPHAVLGIRLPAKEVDINYIKQELIYAIFLDMVFGKGSDSYQRLLDLELINDTFYSDITLEEDYGFIMIGSNTFDYETFYLEVKESILSFFSNPIDHDKFNRILKQITGGFIHGLNSVEYIANQYTKYLLEQANLFDILDVAQSITIDDIKQLKETILDSNRQYTYTLIPKTK
jgi:insulysin